VSLSVGRSVGRSNLAIPLLRSTHYRLLKHPTLQRASQKTNHESGKKGPKIRRKAQRNSYRLRVKIHCSVRYHRCTGFAHSFSSHHHNATMRGLPSKSQLTSTPKLTSQRTQAHREPKLTLTLTLTLTHKMRVSECVSE